MNTYRINSKAVSGFTLGAFTGYFRHRQSRKNITFAYSDYTGHFVVGIIYSRTALAIDERQSYTIADLPHITSVANNFDFILQEKWRIAHDKAGSGNTKNIGSIKNIKKLLSGNGTFAPYNQKIFDEAGMELQQGSGRLSVSKPNLVNWQTTLPDESLIVSDGSNLWFYDPSVEQVSVYS